MTFAVLLKVMESIIEVLQLLGFILISREVWRHWSGRRGMWRLGM